MTGTLLDGSYPLSFTPMTVTPLEGSYPLFSTPTNDTLPDRQTSRTGTPTVSHTHAQTRKVLSDFLACPNSAATCVTTPVKKTEKRNLVSGPQVLTSSEALALLEEKKRMKQEEVLEKDRKKNKRKEKRRRNRRLLRGRKRKKTDEKRWKKRRRRIRRASTRSTTSCVHVQVEEVSSNECAACLGLYEENISDGELLYEWVQSTDQYCNK